MTSHPAVDEREPGLSGPLAIMVLDVAESGKLIKRNMEEYVRRWEAFVGEGARPHLSDSRCLRTKSLGDGLRLLMHEPADAQERYRQALELLPTARPAMRGRR